MKPITEDIKQIYRSERVMLIVMILNFLGAAALFVLSIMSLNPDSAVVKIGYGDIGGYRNGSWNDMLTFPILAIILGVLHNFIALRIFRKRGAGMTKFFVFVTSAIIAGSFIVLFRLTGNS